MNVVYITDKKYYMPTCVSIVSLMKHVSAADIYIVCDGLSKDQREELCSLGSEKFSLSLIETDGSCFTDIPMSWYEDVGGGYVSRTALFKFELPHLLQGLKKALYLDGDIVINGRITELYDLDLQDGYLAAADDMGIKYINSNDEEITIYTEGSYFNSGVMLLNLQKMRDDNISEKLLLYRTNHKNRFMDQDAFNAVIGRRRKKIDVTYNFHTKMIDIAGFKNINNEFFEGKYNSVEEMFDDQAILHFTGNLKPWEYMLYPATSIFQKYYRMSIYGSRVLELESPIYELMTERNNAMKTVVEQSETIRYLNHCKSVMEWKFPFDRISENNRIILYGAGEVGRFFKRKIENESCCRVVLWVDQNYRNNREIANPEEIKNVDFDFIFIAISRETIVIEVEDKLKRMGISEKRIISL